MTITRTFLAASLMFATASTAWSQQASDTLAPERAAGSSAGGLVRAEKHMVVAANPLAAQAGLAILRQGGSAADALVAVQTTLGLVEPQSSGIGGGAFLVWYDAQSRTVTTFDGRETAPKAATGDLFLGDDGQPLGFFDAVVGGRSVGVPGVPRLMETIHERAGKLPWADLFAPAITLSRDGFKVSPRLAGLISSDSGRLDAQPSTRAYFYGPDGAALAAGATLINESYADTLDALAAGGADAFYEGPIADAIVAAVRDHPTNPGLLSANDFKDYRIVERDAVCAPYRDHEICGMGPPSSGAMTIGQILGMVEPYEIGALGPDDPESWRIIGDATRLAFADRDRYMADSDFVDMPEGLLDADYLAGRSALIRQPTALGQDDVTAGEPPWKKADLRIDGVDLSQPATTHFVIVDDSGNIASMTSSIENGFGARLMVGGFLLNNQLTDFSFAATGSDGPVANRVEGGKRPRSSMAPTIVLLDGEPRYALGSPGGSNIISYVANTLIGLIDWDLDMAAAIARPHMVNRFGPYDIELGTAAEDLVEDLAALGYEVEAKELNSGLHGIEFTPSGLEGAADTRREGVAVGD
ncbi:gamma-glutamyltransferase [Mesorhizobium sp. CAU 1732]|uniref:gamma-glutamyltransferase n=1 Tax=Mesorhizobium sp. CAU 1732 TaxID=3140358 RepID=UPI00326111ED